MKRGIITSSEKLNALLKMTQLERVSWDQGVFFDFTFHNLQFVNQRGLYNSEKVDLVKEDGSLKRGLMGEWCVGGWRTGVLFSLWLKSMKGRGKAGTWKG